MRHLKTNVADLRKGDWIDHEGKALVVQSVASSHSGRGARSFLVTAIIQILTSIHQIFYQITTKDAITQQVVVIKPNPRDDFEKMEMQDTACQFMYSNGDEEIILMNGKTFEEYSVPTNLVDPKLLKLLEGGTQVKLRMTQGRPIMVSSNPCIKCTIANILETRESSDKKRYCDLIRASFLNVI